MEKHSKMTDFLSHKIVPMCPLQHIKNSLVSMTELKFSNTVIRNVYKGIYSLAKVLQI